MAIDRPGRTFTGVLVLVAILLNQVDKLRDRILMGEMRFRR